MNGIAARAVELCEGSRGLQPSPHILPGVLAIAEQRGLGGRAMLGAFVLGYEVAGRLNRGYTPRAFSHPNGQLSLLGAAAAGARLHGLDGAGVSPGDARRHHDADDAELQQHGCRRHHAQPSCGDGRGGGDSGAGDGRERLRGAGRRDRGGARRHGGRGLRPREAARRHWDGGGRSWKTISASTPAAIRSMRRWTAWPRPWPC